jgi:pimeloyl-ACP methyl ester carboxylesterase
MRVRTAGEGPLVVKVAGLAGGVELFHEELRRARAAGFRVAALDNSGDRLDDPASGSLSWDGLAAEVVEALDRHEAERAVLWGTSFGSLICLAVAARYPERVRGMLLCTPPLPGWRPRLHLALFRYAAARRNPAAATARWFAAGFLLLNCWEFLNPVALWRLPGLARASLDARTPATTILDKLRLLFEGDPGLPAEPARMPTAIIAGRWDTVTSPSASGLLAKRLPGARLHRLALTGHSCAYSRPWSYAERALAELGRLTS